MRQQPKPIATATYRPLADRIASTETETHRIAAELRATALDYEQWARGHVEALRALADALDGGA